MIKKLLFIVLLTSSLFTSLGAQSSRHPGHDKKREHDRGAKVKMAKFDKKAMLLEDKVNEQDKVGGMRFAKSFDVNYTPENVGLLSEYADGTKKWELEINSDSAYSINLIFSKFHLLSGDTLRIYNELGGLAIGPLTQQHNLQSGILPLMPVDGSSIKVEFIQSALISSTRKLEIGSVNHDYRGFRGLPYSNESTLSMDTCSLPVSCVSEITQVKRSVCLLILNGSKLCSGTMMNNTAQDGKPYLLTAAHCLDIGSAGVDSTEAANGSPTIVAFFNYEMPNCDKKIRGSQEFTIGGATLRAFAANIDFALVELSSKPPVDYRPYYAGWDIAASPSPPFRGIHHPYGKVKVMALDDDAITNVSYGGGMLSNSHWLVSNWETGTTQEGSSGSGIFDANLRLVGALTGGNSECTSPINDFYYRLNKAWDTNSIPSRQLKAWLSPSSSVTSLNGFNPYGNDSALRISNFNLTDIAEKAYLTGANAGLIGGQNSLSIGEYAERFSLPENAYLYGVYLIPSKGNANQTATNIINVRVYAGTTVPNPAYFLDEKQVDLSTLQWITDGFYNTDKAVLTKNENYIKFDTPIAVGDNFFIAYTVPYGSLPADTFAIYTAKDRGVSGVQTALVYNGANWIPMSDISGTHTSLWIDPVIRYDSTAIAVDTNLVERSNRTVIFPNPADDIVYVMTRSDKYGACEVTLYSSFGQKISVTKDKVRYPNIEISVQGLPAGVYLLRVAYSDKTEIHKLIVK